MSDYFATVEWQRDEQLFIDEKYSRAHVWDFDGGLRVPASASPHIVPLPYSVEANVDPEEAFVASLSSCHMLFFLSIAAKQGYIVDSYLDKAIGTLEKDDSGTLSMTKVVLRPKVVWSAKSSARLDELEAMHKKAHELCFIANSVKTEVIVEVVN